MPRRNPVLATGEVYHVFNRSVGKEYTFSHKSYLSKIIEIVDYYRFPQQVRLSQFKLLPQEVKKAYHEAYIQKPPLVEIYAFSFMPNHYHFLLRQLVDGGIVRFTANVQNSFAKYFNLRSNRHGTLFENAFKARRPETDEEALHVSRYIHLNPVTAFLIEFDQLAHYRWTSFPLYVNEEVDSLLKTDFLLQLIGSRQKYRAFVEDQVDYQRTLDKIKHFVLE